LAVLIFGCVILQLPFCVAAKSLPSGRHLTVWII
jgi:hypothetical protein